SEDRELLAFASYAPKSQPIPNLFFASVLYLIVTGIQHEYRNFYLIVVTIPKKKQNVFPISHDFVCNIVLELYLYYYISLCKRVKFRCVPTSITYFAIFMKKSVNHWHSLSWARVQEFNCYGISIVIRTVQKQHTVSSRVKFFSHPK